MMNSRNQGGLAEIALYVHLPWCVRKCPYCDFNSHPVPASLPETEYVAALLADLESDLDLVAGRRVASIFLGGGTPSLFGADALRSLLSGIAGRLPLATDAEITLEANPGTVEHGRFAAYAGAGINRVSLGAQSFDPGQLTALGRIHGPGETIAAVDELRAAGIVNFNLDLLYALPGQTTAGAVADVAAALALGPAHLSCYQLTLEPGSAFHRRPPVLPDDEAAWEMEVACHEALGAGGLARYEVSAWARPGLECRHNLNYWRYGDYLGIGAGAHGKITSGGSVIRTERPPAPLEFMQRSRARRSSVRRIVPEAELPFEFMLNRLRLRTGFTLAEFEQATGLPGSTVEARLEQLRSRGLMSCTSAGWRPTALGFRFMNDLQRAFL